jgi:surface carbohydrate biosynthesis protein
MDFLIVYERKNRELENAILLKLELERRGYSCDIAQYYDASMFDVFNRNPPKVVLTPHLYETSNVIRTLSRFGRANHIVNLQYEQVLSEKWERLGHHNPKGEATKAFHICWGSKTAERLLNAGIPEDNIKVLGALQLDLLRKEYRRTTHDAKVDLSVKYNLPQQSQWKLFLSSFTYADIDEDRLKMNESVAGTKLSSFVDIHTKSRDEILDWFDKVLQQDRESIFIYRPHPDELSLDKVVELSKKYHNFRIINEGAAKIWIEGSDHILSWYSTTVVESHALDKSYSILRPFELPGDFDSVLLKNGSFVEN